MIKKDNKHLMFIEPKLKKMEIDINDELTDFAYYLESIMKSNNDLSKGWHSCVCGKAHSQSNTFSVSLAGVKVKTNSLLVHYVKNHRSEVPIEELEKLLRGIEYWNQKNLANTKINLNKLKI